MFIPGRLLNQNLTSIVNLKISLPHHQKLDRPLSRNLKITMNKKLIKRLLQIWLKDTSRMKNCLHYLLLKPMSFSQFKLISHQNNQINIQLSFKINTSKKKMMSDFSKHKYNNQRFKSQSSQQRFKNKLSFITNLFHQMRMKI